MKFIHIADVHLGMSFKSASFGKEFGKQKRKAIKKNIQGLINHIKEDGIDLLLIAGDFFEGDYVELSDVLDIKYLFESIPGTHIVIMAGNHDPLSTKENIYDLVKWPENVMIIGSDISVLDLEDLDTSIVSMSWKTKGPLTLDKVKLEEQLREAKCKSKIIMLHGDVYTKSEYLYMEKSYLESLNADYIALGHIHKPDFINSHIAYPGSLEPLDFSENYSHGYIQGEINDSTLSANHIESMVLPMFVIPVDISGKESYLELIEYVKKTMLNDISINNHTNLMVRIILKGEKNPYIGQVEELVLDELKELLGQHIVYIELKDESLPGYDIELLYEEHKDDVIGYFIKAMKEKEGNEEVNNQALLTGISLLLEAMR